jgi:hypothetical protein
MRVESFCNVGSHSNIMAPLISQTSQNIDEPSRRSSHRHRMLANDKPSIFGLRSAETASGLTNAADFLQPRMTDDGRFGCPPSLAWLEVPSFGAISLREQDWLAEPELAQSNERRLASHGNPNWNQIHAFLQQMARLREVADWAA